MATEVEFESIRPGRTIVYKKVAPDGGYGYVIVAAMTLFVLSTIVPHACFGFIYGSYLADRGDETSSVTTVASLYSCVYHFAGILSNPLLQKWPQRTIGLIGAILICCGNIGTIFIKTVNHLAITYGLVQGLGIGFLLPASMTAFNDYFALRKNLLMGLSQTATTAITILYPVFIRFLLDLYGFRGTVAIIAALNSHVIFAALALHPVKWHLKKVVVKETEIESVTQGYNSDVRNEIEPSNRNGEDGQLLKKNVPENGERMHMTRPSVASIGSFTVPVDVRDNKTKSFWKSLDFSVLKDPVYYNLILGISLNLMSEYNFITILPGYLSKHEYTKGDISMVMTTYFASDLGGRLFYITCMSMVNITNRTVILIASVFAGLVRLAFSINTNYLWVMITTGGLGALRGFFHTPIPLTIAEEYSDKFASAFTLFMVICGMVAYAVGHILNGAKRITQSEEVVMHILTMLNVIVVVCWSIELICKRAKGIKPRPKPANLNISH